MARIYVASSWRNSRQQKVVGVLREAGHLVYDFRNQPNNSGFRWSKIDPNWERWTARDLDKALSHPTALGAFASDFNALRTCDVCLMLQPCGRSAAMEFGWASGAGKRTVILLDQQEPELMLLLADKRVEGICELLAWLHSLEAYPENGQ